MPMYSFTNEKTGETIEELLSYEDTVPRHIIIGKVRYDRDIGSDFKTKAQRSGDAWPLYSEGMGVLPSQVRELQEFHAKQGTKVECDSQGRVKCENRAHRAKLLKERGFHDRDGGYKETY